ncbi:MAG: hypothetical protein FGM60_05685 [Candidatus Planktophila sp.]|nr:hypothetical protein [Candidatus Planktophila sp.]
MLRQKPVKNWISKNLAILVAITSFNLIGMGQSYASTSAGPATATATSSVETSTVTNLNSILADSDSLTVTGFPETMTIIAVLTTSRGTLSETATAGVTTATGYQSPITAEAASIAVVGAPSAVNAALQTVRYHAPTTGGSTTITLDVSARGSDAIAFNSTNGHYYQYVSTAVTWNSAYNTITTNGSVNRSTCYYSFNGMCGYFATSTSAQENSFITSKVGTSAAWLGGSDNASEGVWKWVDDKAPSGERGVQFSDQRLSPIRTGLGVGSPATYVNWNNNEPNDSGSDEDALQIVTGGSGNWNDLPTTGSTMGYIVEYGGNGETLTYPSASRTITVNVNIPTPTFGSVTSTSTGFTVQISNYNNAYTYETVTVTGGGSVSINGSGLMTITGLSAGGSSTVTIRAKNGSFSSSNAVVTGSATTPTDNSYKVGSEAFLKGSYVQVGGGSNGHFGTVAAPPSSATWRNGLSRARTGLGFIADRDRNGTWKDGDFFMPGSPYEGWYIDVAGTTGKFDDRTTSGLTGSQSYGDVYVAASRMYVVHTTVVNEITIEQTYSVPIGTGTFSGDQQLNISVKLTNNGAASKSGILYARSVDPDNLVDQGGGFSTFNKIQAQYGSGGNVYSLVSATSPDSRGGTSYIGLFSSDSRSKVSRTTSGFGTPATAAALFTGGSRIVSATDSGANADAGIQLGVDVGTLAAGASTTFDFAYVLSASSAASAIAAAQAPPAPDVVTGNETATVSWDAPESADPITGYAIEYRETSTADWSAPSTVRILFTSDTRTAQTIINGTTNGTSTPLTNGTAYLFRVAAITGTNTIGTWSTATQGILMGRPGALEITSATVSGETATVVFNPATSPIPDKPVTNYQYSIDNGVTWISFSPVTTTSPVSFPGILAGNAYPTLMRAINFYGPGPSESAGTLYGLPVWVDNTLGTLRTSAAFTDGVDADSGVTSYTVSAGTLPAGLTLDSTTGAITGTPSVDGDYSFTIRATNPTGSITQAFSGTFTYPAGVPTWTTTTFGSLTTGSAVSLTGLATGATSYAVHSGTLPTGLSLNTSTGAITGTPTVAGAYTVTLRAINGSGYRLQTFTGNVGTPSSGGSYPLVQWVTLTIGSPTVGSPFNFTLLANYATVYSILSGSLPAGLTLNSATGVISGTPTISGNYSFQVLANNAYNTGQALLFTGSVKAAVTPTPTPTPTPTQETNQGTTPTPTPSATPSSTPTPTATATPTPTSSAKPTPKPTATKPAINKPQKAAVIGFAFKSFEISNKSRQAIKQLQLTKAKSIAIYGYASNNNTSDDIRISLDRAIMVRKELQKLFPNLKIVNLGMGAKPIAACKTVANRCAVVIVRA